MTNYDFKNVNNMATQQKQVTPIVSNTPTTNGSRFRKSFAVGGHKPDKEHNTQPSTTIPGQAMSIGEMLKRTQAGLPINNSGHVPIYNGERILPKWKDLDLIDRAAIIKDAQQKVDELESRKKTIEARIKQKVAERAKERSEKGDIPEPEKKPETKPTA